MASKLLGEGAGRVDLTNLDKLKAFADALFDGSSDDELVPPPSSCSSSSEEAGSQDGEEATLRSMLSDAETIAKLATDTPAC